MADIEPARGRTRPLAPMPRKALLVLAHIPLDVDNWESLQNVQCIFAPRTRNIASMRECHVTDGLPRPLWSTTGCAVLLR
jgi:hypothetical protein